MKIFFKIIFLNFFKMFLKNLKKKIFFSKFFLKIILVSSTSATDLVNLLYFLRPVSSDHTYFIREFEQDT